MKKICEMCNKSLSMDNFYKNRNSYERLCKRCRLDRNKSRYTHNCKVCDVSFKSELRDSLYCSRKCSATTRMNRVTRTCEICNKPITRPASQFNGKHYIYCSYECQGIGWGRHFSGENSPSWNSDLSDDDREINRKYPEYYEWRESVFNKDNYTCRKCGDNIGSNLNAHHILNYSEHLHLRTDISNGITFCESCHKAFHDTYGYRHNNHSQINDFLNIEKKASCQ